MTDDLRRLRLRGFIQRLTGTHRYRLTSDGLRVVFFFSKLSLRIFRPHGQALESTADAIPRPLRTAFDRLDVAIARIYQEANLAA